MDRSEERAAYADRREAGACLAEQMGRFRGQDALVLALPRGGVVVADEIARALGAPLDVIVARKIGAPGQPELGIGAIAPGGVRVLDDFTIRYLGVQPEAIERITLAEQAEMERRLRAYRGDRPPPDLAGRTVVIVDDGLATGVTARAAVRSARAQGAANIVLAVPVCAKETAESMGREVDEMICGVTPPHFRAVGYWYRDFSQTTDEEVMEILRRHQGAGGEDEAAWAA
jgi:predicted phosphoribosyltransferase